MESRLNKLVHNTQKLCSPSYERLTKFANTSRKLADNNENKRLKEFDDKDQDLIFPERNKSMRCVRTYTCYNEKQFMEKSKEKNRLLEEKLSLKNPQFSFPLYPVDNGRSLISFEQIKPYMPSKSEKSYTLPVPDILLEETNNIGLLMYMAINSSQDKDCKKKSKVKQIKDFKLECGLPYEITNVGTRFDVKECPSPVGKIIEIREIEVIKNPLYFDTSSPSSPKTCTAITHPAALTPATTCAKPTTKALTSSSTPSTSSSALTTSKTLISSSSTSKNINDESEDKDTSTSLKLLAFIIQIPIVSEIPWKQLSILLSENYACDRNKIIDHLRIPKSKFDPKIISILTNSRNREILTKFNKLRRELNNINNNAYVEAMIYALLSSLTANKWTPLFPRLYDTGRAQDSTPWEIWKQYIITQQTDNYYTDILAMYSELDLEMLMAHLFQVVFGLDCAQKLTGFVHNNLDVRYGLHYVKASGKYSISSPSTETKDSKDLKNSEELTYLQYKWNGKYYRIPTYGAIMKLYGFENSTIILDGIKYGKSDNNSNNGNDGNNNNSNNSNNSNV